MNDDTSGKMENIKIQKNVVVIVLVILFCAIFIVFVAHITRPKYIPYQEGLLEVTKHREDISLIFNNNIKSYQHYEISSDEQGIYTLSLYTTAWDTIIKNVGEPNNVILNPNGENVKSLYYVSCGPDDILLYGDNFYGGGVVTLPSLLLVSCTKYAILITVLLALLILLFHKRKKVKALLIKVLLIPTTWLFSQLLITGYNPVSYTAIHDFYFILFLSTIMLLLFVFLYLKSLNRKQS